MGKLFRLLFVGSILVVNMVAKPAQAGTTRHVGSGQTYSKIQDAINAANNGDTVLVHDGTYVENINFIDKAITVKSENGPDVTTIDGSNPSDPNKGSVVTFENGEGNNSVLDGFTITGGIGNTNLGGSAPPGIYAGGGIIIINSSSPKITNCVINNNSTGAGGGILCAFYSSPTITNCIISDNIGKDVGGGIFCVDSSSPSITNCTINNNTSTENGGGIGCDSSSPIIENCNISGNTVDNNGGGISCWDNSLPTITNCTISDNIAAEHGGGIFCNDSSPQITNCTIKNNIATYDNGGGFHFRHSSGTITSCIISGNSANNKNGGGIYLSSSSSPAFINCVISDNSAKYGGAMSCQNYSSPTIINCTIADNSCSDGTGGGVACQEFSSPTVINSILWGNTGAADTPNDVYLSDWGGASSITITYTDINDSYITGPGTLSTGNNINADPLFVGGGNYHLTTGSPCIDTGTSNGAPSNDIDGESRPQGAGFDMGAYEYSGCPHDGDVNQDGGITPQDALMAFQHYLGIIELPIDVLPCADVNNDGFITPADALCIFQKYLGLPSCLD